MKIDLSDVTRGQLEDFFISLVEYQLQGRLMIFQGLCSHREMIGAINVTQSIIGYERGREIIRQVQERPKTDHWKNKEGWKLKDLNTAYTELTKPDHVCSYCGNVPKP